MKNKILFLVIFACLLFGLVKNSEAATISIACSGNITTALNNAISSAVDNDVIDISAGTCSCSSVTVHNKQLDIKGAGQGITNITTLNNNFILENNDSSHANWKVSGMTLTGNSINQMITVSGGDTMTGPNDGWRIDHMTFNYPALSGAAVVVYGASWGLIDNNTVNMAGGLIFDIDGSYTSEDGTIDNLFGSHILAQPLKIGTRQAIYIEDNSIACAAPGGCAVFDTGNVGTRIVFRHNQATNGMIYSHWTRHNSIEGFWFEIYNNKLTWSGSEMFPARIEAGTGVIYNNTFSGFDDKYFYLDERRGTMRGPVLSDWTGAPPLLYCDGNNNWDGNAGDADALGWPCLGQIGRASGKSITQIKAGDKPASFPFYSWNNGEQDKCFNSSATGSACVNTINFHVATSNNYIKGQIDGVGTPHSVTGGGYGQGDFDFCSGGITQPTKCGTHTLVYTPLQYPHPLQGIAPTCTTKGDFTCNGYSISDLQTMISIILGTDTTTNRTQADMNNDTLVNISDLQLLIKKVLGIN